MMVVVVVVMMIMVVMMTVMVVVILIMIVMVIIIIMEFEFSAFLGPEGKPTGLEPDRISSRSVDISWQRVSAPRNGSIDGYRV